MAKIISSDVKSQTVGSYYPFWRIILMSAISGIGLVLLMFLINSFIFRPIACNLSIDAVACANSAVITGNIATIIIAIVGIYIMVRLKLARPLIVAAATAITLWGLMQWMSGLSVIEMICWSVLLYVLAYTLFSWLARIIKIGPALILMSIAVIVVRVVAAL